MMKAPEEDDQTAYAVLSYAGAKKRINLKALSCSNGSSLEVKGEF